MKMYGLTTDQHMRNVREGIDSLQHLLTTFESAPSVATCVEAQFASTLLHDQLRDITLWLDGARGALKSHMRLGSAETPRIGR